MTTQSESKDRGRRAQVGAAGLIEVAERLLAEHGLENVSLREIAANAGLSNPASVQYHFGDRDELIRAIWRTRLPEIDRRRARMLAELDSDATRPRALGLLDCMCRPLQNDLAIFSQFLARVMRSRHHLRARAEFDTLAPATQTISEQLRQQFLQLDDATFAYRLITGLLIVLDAMGPMNPTEPEEWRGIDREAVYQEALAVAYGCLIAPAATDPE